ncbi:MAG: mechanosensitive ion channel family protein, partial [Muribaculaceae bacterium]
MTEYIKSFIPTIATQFNIKEEFVRHYIYMALIVLFALFCGLVFKRLIVPLLKRIIERTSFKFDDYIFTDKIFSLLSTILPSIVLLALLPICFLQQETTSLTYVILQRSLTVFIIIQASRIVGQILSNIVHYTKSDYSDINNHYLEAIMQFVKVVFYFFICIVLISVIINRNPTTLLAGLGAMATVMLLVFQDTILGLVAGVQLNTNKMLKVGDWIEVKGKGINGYVIKVNLTTIKIRNFDNSISTIPPHQLVSET